MYMGTTVPLSCSIYSLSKANDKDMHSLKSAENFYVLHKSSGYLRRRIYFAYRSSGNYFKSLHQKLELIL